MNPRKYLKDERTTAPTNGLNFFWSYYGEVAQLVDTSLLITVASALALGFALVLKDYIASFTAGIVFRSVGHIKRGRRVKILTVPTIKGDILNVGPIRTSLMEVGDGERLPSVQTGRVVKVPNFMLLNNPVLIYGDTIIDEVIAYTNCPNPDLGIVIGHMKEAIASQGHKVIEVGVYQKEDRLVVHGIFESNPRDLTDARSSILREFLEKENKEPKVSGESSGNNLH